VGAVKESNQSDPYKDNSKEEEIERVGIDRKKLNKKSPSID